MAGIERVDAVVIGAGVVGLAIARALAMHGREVLVLEREPAIGTGISSRSSEVIHAGLYYPTGSWKARLCVQGRRALYGFCESHGVAHRRCGKLLVATDAAQLSGLDAVQARAVANGVDDLVRLDAAQARAMEPELRCEAALWSPSTGIVDSHGLMLALQGDLERHGGAVVLSSPMLAVRLAGQPGAQAHRVEVGGAEPMAIEAGLLINATGLAAPRLASAMQGLGAAHQPRGHFCKGNYYALAGRAPFSRLIYPLPQQAGLGVHLTLDLGGQARFGPDVQWLPDDTQEPIDYRVDPARAEAFYAEVRRYWPGLRDGALQPAYSGVRPKLAGPGEPAGDFVIEGPAQHGVRGLVNLFGIESPGLTACLALADEVLARAA